MPTTEARIDTDRAERYLAQLCQHASRITHGLRMPTKISADWSDTHGVITAAGGTCTVSATPEALLLRIEADDEPALHRLRDTITRNLDRFSSREPLTVTWQGGDRPGSPVPTGGRRRTILLALLATLAVAAHLVLVGMLAAPRWTGLIADGILAIVLVKAALLGAAYYTRHRRRAAKTR